MKTLNQVISDYTSQLKQGEIQIAYKGILEFISKLRTDLIKKYPCYEIGSLYQGYLDMSYFSLNTKLLKDKGLKIAIVYLHEKGAFEGWLSARNREISKKYESVLINNISELNLFHDANNQDAIIECTLMSAPDFEDHTVLIDIIEQSVQKFTDTITRLLSNLILQL